MNELGRFGVWRSGPLLSPSLAVEFEALGYGTVWIGTSPGGDLGRPEELLDATTTLTVATGIVNIWKDDAADVAASFHRVEAKHPGRFLLGVGVGHPEATGDRYAKPYEALVHYLDELDAAAVPVGRRALAALGPRVLSLARDRTAGAHPYLVTPEHTRLARAILGPGPLLAPEQKVVLDDDPVRARALARSLVPDPYFRLTNYIRNLRSLGFDDADLAGEGSDRLIDALVAHGSLADVAAHLQRHLDAGADHVAIQLLTASGEDPVPGLAALAGVLPA